VSLVRIGGQLVDDERTCVVPGCDSHAPVEPYQAELPAKADELHRKAETYERLAKEARAEAEALSAEIETAQPHAFLCGGHKALLPPQLGGRWQPAGAWSVGLPMGGRAADEPGSQGETDTVAMTLAALYHEPAPAGL
jgi:hypothetical protein